MSKTSLVHRTHIFSHNDHQSSLLPHPSKIISDSANLIPNPSQILSNSTKLLTEPSKILSETTKILPDPTEILPTNLLSEASSKILSPTNLLTAPSKLLSTLLSSATNNPLTSMLSKVLTDTVQKLLELLMLLILSFSPRHFLIIGAVLLILFGLAVAGTVLGLIILLPLLVILSPVWVPAGTALFVVTAGFLTMFGFVLVSVIVVAWLVQHLFNALLDLA